MNMELIRNAVAEAAQRFGAQGYELTISSQEDTGVEALNREVNGVSYARSGAMTVRCVVDGKSGYAVSELLTPEAASDAVEQACANAGVVDDLDEMPLFPGSEHYEEVCDVVPVLPSTDEMKAMALELQEKTYAASDKIVDGSQSQVSGMKVAQALMNSAGLDLSYASGMVYRVAMAAVKDNGTASRTPPTITPSPTFPRRPLTRP